MLIEFVGGPEDGHQLEIPEGAFPPLCYFRPRVDQGLSFTALPQVDMVPILAHDTYQIMLDETGHYSRSESGALRYLYRRTP